MKIHFVSFIGVDYDLDLSPWWIPYYRNQHLDSYTVFLHRLKGDVSFDDRNLFIKAGFDVKCVEGPFNDGSIRNFYLRNFAENLDPHDMLITADGDEFQCMPDGSPVNYNMTCRQYKILHGLHEDHYARLMEPCHKNPFEQYPNIEKYTGEYRKTITIPFIKETPSLIRTKILAAPAGLRLEYNGSHCILDPIPSNAKILFDCKVVHFAWRRNSVNKILDRSYFPVTCKKQLEEEYAMAT